jgi:23S rRNA pseudouridine1911/1915/1917 synthase
MKRFANVEVLYTDNHLVIANKPAGLLTQPTSQEPRSLERQVKGWMKKKYNKPGDVYLHAVHRLDRPVSGLVLFAKTSKALSRLNEMSRNQEIQRVYVAEVEGLLPYKLGKLDHYLVKSEHRALVVDATTEGAKHARLAYKVLHYMPDTTFVEVELETGRYHQIRSQFAAEGHPIVGDVTYGAKAAFEDSTIHLHAAHLAFKHPITQELVKVYSSPPFEEV